MPHRHDRPFAAIVLASLVVTVGALMVWIWRAQTACDAAVCSPGKETMRLMGECYCMEKAGRP
jgi:hypothetical protein